MFSIVRCVRSSILREHQLTQLQKQSKCFVSLMKIGGTGDPFKTTIRRKNEIVDPNKPKFIYNEKPESLKWPCWHVLKDVKKRFIVSEYFPTRSCLLQIFRYKSLPFELREHSIGIIRHKFPRKSRWRSGNLRYHCILTGRSRGRVMRFKVSRFMFRQGADYNKLSGIIKGKWGWMIYVYS